MSAAIPTRLRCLPSIRSENDPGMRPETHCFSISVYAEPGAGGCIALRASGYSRSAAVRPGVQGGEPVCILEHICQERPNGLSCVS